MRLERQKLYKVTLLKRTNSYPFNSIPQSYNSFDLFRICKCIHGVIQPFKIDLQSDTWYDPEIYLTVIADAGSLGNDMDENSMDNLNDINGHAKDFGHGKDSDDTDSLLFKVLFQEFRVTRLNFDVFIDGLSESFDQFHLSFMKCTTLNLKPIII